MAETFTSTVDDSDGREPSAGTAYAPVPNYLRRARAEAAIGVPASAADLQEMPGIDLPFALHERSVVSTASELSMAARLDFALVLGGFLGGTVLFALGVLTGFIYYSILGVLFGVVALLHGLR
ncbi:MAG: hypothetical protein V3U30_03630 [Thermoplasmata archaeon]